MLGEARTLDAMKRRFIYHWVYHLLSIARREDGHKEE